MSHNESPYDEELAYDVWFHLSSFNEHYCKILIEFLIDLNYNAILFYLRLSKHMYTLMSIKHT